MAAVVDRWLGDHTLIMVESEVVGAYVTCFPDLFSAPVLLFTQDSDIN